MERQELKHVKAAQQPELHSPWPPGSARPSAERSTADCEQAAAATAASERALAAAQGRERQLRERVAQLEQELSRAQKAAHAGAQDSPASPLASVLPAG